MTEEQTLEEFFAQEKETTDEQEQVSRREFLRSGLAGGAAGLVAAAGTGAAVWKITDEQMQAALADADAEIARLQGLVALYEDLEQIGLDAILETGMAAVAIPLEGIELGAKALKAGLDLVEEGVLSLEQALPTAQESILWLESQISALASGIATLEEALGRALGQALDNPVAQALGEFARLVLDNLPFGLGDRIRDVLDGLVTLVTGLDDLLEGFNAYVLEPLRETWFSTEEGEGVEATLLTPLVVHVLDPLEAHLEGLAELVDAWQGKLMAPTERALVDRAKVKESIVQYKTEHGLE